MGSTRRQMSDRLRHTGSLYSIEDGKQMATERPETMFTADQKLSRFKEAAFHAATELGLTLLNIHLVQPNSLEICVHRQEVPISFADCEAMTNGFTKHLKAEDMSNIIEFMTVEVVSPGIDRCLTTSEELKIFAGKPIRVTTKQKIDNLGIEFIGVLAGNNESSVTINQAEPLPSKSNNHRNTGKKKVSLPLKDSLTLMFSDIYGIYLWPGLKFHSGK